ncbi:MAG: protein kinase [Planctomycetes bacterium]|nr:protein kinase [Planctomycetota bacterium]
MARSEPNPKDPADDVASDESDPKLELYLQAAYGASLAKASSAESVLLRVRQAFGSAPRITLRAPSDGGGAPAETAAAQLSVEAIHGGRYQLLGEIGRGGMGVVMRGRDLDLGRDIAIKVLEPSRGQDAAHLRRFLEEAQIGGQLQHPGLVPVHELGLYPDGRPFFTMKLVEGETLASILRRRVEPSQDRWVLLNVLHKVCQTIAYAHARGVIHRDLKPANVMLGRFGEVQVIDWGLAKVLDPRAEPLPGDRPPAIDTEHVRTHAEGSRSQSGVTLGTPAYMAPEQARGEIERVDQRADVFSLGAMLCEILIGNPPYGGEKEEILDRARRCDTASTLAALQRCSVDASLVEIALDCLAADPEQRPLDAGVLALRVGEYLSSADARARSAELQAAEERARATAERRARRLTAVLAAVVLLGFVVAWIGWTWMEAQREVQLRAARLAAQTAIEETRVALATARAAARDDLSSWPATQAAAARAVAFSTAEFVPVDQRERAKSLRAEVDAAEAIARATAARVLQDRGMLETLERIREEMTRDFEWKEEDLRFTTAFREYGIDLDALPPAEAARRIQASEIASTLIEALDWWRWTRSGQFAPGSAEAQRLKDAVIAADPDPWRVRLRETRSSDRANLAAFHELANAPQAADQPKGALLILARKLQQAGDPEACCSLLQKLHFEYPDDFWINYWLGYSFFNMSPRQPEQALRFATAALACRPDSEVAMGLVHNVLERDPIALTLAERGARLYPESPVVRANHGAALARAGRHDEAIRVMREVQSTFPGISANCANLAFELLEVGRIEEAIELIPELLAAPPLDHGRLCKLGRKLFELGCKEQARDVLEHAALQDPSCLACSFALATLLQGAELARVDSEDRIRAELEKQPENVRLLTALGQELSRLERVEEAIHVLREALRLHPQDWIAHNVLGELLVSTKSFPEARAAFLRAIELHPPAYPPRAGLARVLHRMGKLEAAVQEYEALLRVHPDSAESCLEVSDLLACMGRYGEAWIRFESGRRQLHRRKDLKPEFDRRAGAYEAFAELDLMMAGLITGRLRDLPEMERYELAVTCRRKRFWGLSARLFERALEESPELLREQPDGTRFDAVVSALVVASGKAADATGLDAAARNRWRELAARWLGAEIESVEAKLAGGVLSGSALEELMQRTFEDPALTRFRSEELLGTMDLADRLAWQHLWDAGAALRAMVRR